MDAQARQSLQESEQVHKGMLAITGFGATVFSVALIVWFWGQWSVMLALLAVSVCLLLSNEVLIEWMARRLNRSVAEVARTLINAAGIAVCGAVAHWSALVWIFVPYNLLWSQGVDPWARHRMVAFLVLVDVAALSTGAEVSMTVAFTLLGIFGYVLSERRATLLRGVLGRVMAQREELEKANQELEKAHQELQQLHQRAIEQEKLSSLGMLAAGVAHEINNPMSFVTSNVSSMLRDLRDEQDLSEVMKEYVEDVLPATLDGIRRVNAIVADLRRFARGDPEAHSGFDLDAEVESALRIAKGQLGHLRVEKDLGGVGTVVGRARQIVQVLVNLLVNAGHATAAGGSVRVTTRRDKDGIRLEVRDTGAGMSEETKRHLFEPFFTTKPAGEGTGLGLSVVHGIVRSHGGRIEVESELKKGTCFIIRLPLVPPLPSYEPPSFRDRRMGG
ncbi:MAG TPA: ATP-binding protein [Archangium sp.]|jgi:signal transduction histidine kinase|uniref:sensor histidine kinase n=1 Tax=Archangium sp. TaxID=1872627 RepID=UPI002EDAFB68